MTDLELHHYEAFPVTFDRTRTYDQHINKRPTGKPAGLWVSVVGEDDWKWWCESEEFHLDGLSHVHRVTLHPGNVLFISSCEELTAFHLEWSVETEFERTMAERRNDYLDTLVQRNGLTYVRNQWQIDWERVAQVYAGIIIAPYLWACRLDGPFWYYGWDCASGVIWDLSVIDTFELIEGTGRFNNLDVQELNTPE